MKFKIQQNTFYEGINNVQRAVSNKQTMPILTGIYIEAVKEKGLHLIATNLELGIECWISGEIENEGEIVLPANHLTNIVRELPQKEINIEVDTETFGAELKCANSEFNIKGFDPEEFPQLPEVNVPGKIKIQANKLKNLIDDVKFSISNDESQPALTGALMEMKENNIALISTNTYRLSYSKIKLNSDKINKQNDINKIIIPGDTLNELSKLLTNDEKEVEILINSNYTSFNFEKITVISRLIEGQFPNYEQVIPDECNTKITVDKNELQHATKRASLIARLDSNVISLSTEDNIMTINSIESEAGKAHEEVEINIDGPDQKINIDAGYLLDVLKIINTEQITINLIGPLNPLTIKKGNDYIYLIMPMRSE